MDLIVKYLQQWNKGKRSDFIKLLGNKLPDILNETQKINKIRNLLAQMQRAGIIEREDNNQKTGTWILTKE